MIGKYEIIDMSFMKCYFYFYLFLTDNMEG